MGIKLRYLLFFLTLTAQSQIEQGTLFSEAIEKNIKHYKQQSQNAYANHNFQRGEFLFDSLISHVVNGSYLDNFKVKKRSGRKIDLYKFKKPIFLMTYASWCTPGIGEVPALNAIAKTHYKDIDFVILFWDSKKNVRKSSKKYFRKIKVVYVDESENINNHVIEVMKHSLGFPTSFFIDANKKIVDVRRGALHPYNKAYEVSYELNYNSFKNGISLLKNLDTQKKDRFAAKQNP
ncbi:TlpA family protein disulfide reductase [Aequorivita marina]|uniref:TlpA family protein disulfide reductase n=1 Tax=Aequorivita marina TaxID=3073654 RepID=UPI002876829A|nr:TlpA disulfide reductase family protein [Aequorivita sp. S2608]MDS1299580.1 TlpA disulfide reductase family protein [Aequorivita sp. S2608]